MNVSRELPVCQLVANALTYTGNSIVPPPAPTLKKGEHLIGTIHENGLRALWGTADELFEQAHALRMSGAKKAGAKRALAFAEARDAERKANHILDIFWKLVRVKAETLPHPKEHNAITLRSDWRLVSFTAREPLLIALVCAE